MGGSSGPAVMVNTGNAEFLKAARNGKLEEVLECLKRNIDINTNNACGLNALHLASKEGHVNVVVELLKRGANVNAATKKGNTALHIASLAGREEVVKILVRNGANVNVQSQNGFTPLYMAAQENHDSVVKFLLSNGANQSLATEDGFTPLAVALQQGHDKVVAVLLENDAKGRVRLPALHIAAKKDDCKAAALLLQNDHDPDVTSKSGFTPLHIAAHYGNENIATLLLEKNADVNFSAKHQITPLHVAAKWGKSNMVNLLLDRGGKIDASTRDGLTPLHCAARSGHDQVVDLLLEQGAPITAKTKNGLAPLHMASQGDHVDGARILLYHKAPVDDVTVDYLTALHVAAHCGHVRVAKLLLDRKADPNARALNGFTPLHIACKKNRIKVVELLLKHGASIEATTESGLTPLHVASFMGCMNIVIYLIQHGANPDVPTVRGETPLHLAARAKQADIIRILLRNGAHVDAAAREQQTPLHIAARLGNVDIVGLLLQHGATVDATTKDMYTALHIAAKEGQEEVASVLLDHGASLTATTKKGFTPLHLAAKYGNIRVARLLLQKDAPVDSQGKNGVTPLHVAAHYDHVNVALLLLDKGAYPHATAKNGYTPLHIAAKKNQMDIATTLLEYGAKPNAESKAGFTPLHLAAQEGHTDMTTLLIEHHANVNSSAKNGLTPLHLCAQEDRVNVAAILVKNGADIGPPTKVGYTPLHVACHFGQINMIRFLLQHGADVNATTSHGYTPLHQAAQQGHTLIINLLLEHKASPNNVTSLGQTALSIAQRLGYVSVVETLKIVTETVVTTTTTTVTEEKYKVVAPETMQETFMSDSEDEGDDIEDVSLYGKPAHATHVYLPYIEGQRLLQTEDTTLADQSFRYLTADEMKSLGDDSLPIDVTGDERGVDLSTLSAPTAEEDHLTPQHYAHHDEFSSAQADNVELSRAPIHAGFLVSFMVDARGGAMRGCRHSGVRVIIPPRKAPMPMRITCRYLRKEKLAYPPPLMEGEACASRILEVGPAGAKFLGPVIIEVPHFASLRGREREIMILRSDNGETWREHTLEASDDAVHDVFNESFEGEELTALDDLNTNRITRILTTDFPQYFAIVTRIRQEVHAIGSEGGMVSSTVVPQVQAIFSEGALTKKIKVGLQAQPIPPELVAKLLGNRVAVSPIVTVEPRRRKFHKPITLTIPVPQAAMKGMINQYTSDASTLRLLCSITGGTTKAQWEDVTGSTPLTLVNDCVSFTTTVSARFWLMDCRQVNEATKYATELYREAIHVPFMAKFVVFAKRHDPVEAQLRVFCMTDDKEDKTLESQEHFTEVAKSRDVEVLEAKDQYLEFAGNLIPVTKSGEQLNLTFQAFRENRLPFTIRVKDPHQEPLGRIAFMREPRVGRGEPPQHPICNLNIVLPETQLTPVSELISLEKKYGFMDESGFANPDLIHRADLRLTDIAKELKEDWVPLALQLDVPESDINSIRSECPDSVNQQAIVMLRHWLQRSGAKASGNNLEKALRKINREDIVNKCMFNVELVTDDVEKAVAKVHLDQSGFDTFKEELGSSREASLKRDSSLNGILDDRDIMKEAESAAETSSESSEKETHLKGDVQDEQTEEVSEEAFIKEAVTSPESTLIGQDSGIPDREDREFVKKTTTSYIVEPGDDGEYMKTETITRTTVHTDTKVEVDVDPQQDEEDFVEKAPGSGMPRKRNLKTSSSCSLPTKMIVDYQKHEKKRVAKPGTKKVSFDVSYSTLPSRSASAWKKKEPVRRGSWPPASIPGLKSRKKKRRKYMRAMQNILFSSDFHNEKQKFCSIDWLLMKLEPEFQLKAPIAVCEEFNSMDSSDLSYPVESYVSCKPPEVVTSVPEHKCKLLDSFCDCLSPSILRDGKNVITQALARKAALQKLANMFANRPFSSCASESISQNVASAPEIVCGSDVYDIVYNQQQTLAENLNKAYISRAHKHKPFQESRPLQHSYATIPSSFITPTQTLFPVSVDATNHPSIIDEMTPPKSLISSSSYRMKSAPIDSSGTSSKNSRNKSESCVKESPSTSSSSSKVLQSHSLPGSSAGTPIHSVPVSDTQIMGMSKSPSSEQCTKKKEKPKSDISGKVKPTETDVKDTGAVPKVSKTLEGKPFADLEKISVSASAVGQAFIRTLLEEQKEVRESKTVPSSVLGQVFLKSLIEEEKRESEVAKTIPASVVGQAFLKSLVQSDQSSVKRSNEKDVIPSSVVGQVFLKSLAEQGMTKEIEKENIPASVAEQSILKTLDEESVKADQKTSEQNIVPASVVGQTFIKSILEESKKSESIPASVLGHVFLKALIEETNEKPVPASLVEQEKKDIPTSSVDQTEVHSSCALQEKVIPSTVLSQSFLKSLMEHNQGKDVELGKKVLPASVVGQAFLKTLVQEGKEEAKEKDVIPASVVGQAFLKSLVQEGREEAKAKDVVPVSVVGQTFLKSLVEQNRDEGEGDGVKIIPASVVSQIFLKSLASNDEERPISSSMVEQALEGSSEEKTEQKTVPASVLGQVFLKSLVEQPLETKCEKIIPSAVLGQTFLKTLAEAASGENEQSDVTIPASVIGQAFLKSLLTEQSSKNSDEEKVEPSDAGQLLSKYFNLSDNVAIERNKSVTLSFNDESLDEQNELAQCCAQEFENTKKTEYKPLFRNIDDWNVDFVTAGKLPFETKEFDNAMGNNIDQDDLFGIFQKTEDEPSNANFKEDTKWDLSNSNMTGNNLVNIEQDTILPASAPDGNFTTGLSLSSPNNSSGEDHTAFLTGTSLKIMKCFIEELEKNCSKEVNPIPSVEDLLKSILKSDYSESCAKVTFPCKRLSNEVHDLAALARNAKQQSHDGNQSSIKTASNEESSCELCGCRNANDHSRHENIINSTSAFQQLLSSDSHHSSCCYCVKHNLVSHKAINSERFCNHCKDKTNLESLKSVSEVHAEHRFKLCCEDPNSYGSELMSAVLGSRNHNFDRLICPSGHEITNLDADKKPCFHNSSAKNSHNVFHCHQIVDNISSCNGKILDNILSKMTSQRLDKANPESSCNREMNSLDLQVEGSNPKECETHSSFNVNEDISSKLFTLRRMWQDFLLIFFQLQQWPTENNSQVKPSSSSDNALIVEQEKSENFANINKRLQGIESQVEALHSIYFKQGKLQDDEKNNLISLRNESSAVTTQDITKFTENNTQSMLLIPTDIVEDLVDVFDSQTNSATNKDIKIIHAAQKMLQYSLGVLTSFCETKKLENEYEPFKQTNTAFYHDEVQLNHNNVSEDLISFATEEILQDLRDVFSDVSAVRKESSQSLMCRDQYSMNYLQQTPSGSQFIVQQALPSEHLDCSYMNSVPSFIVDDGLYEQVKAVPSLENSKNFEQNTESKVTSIHNKCEKRVRFDIDEKDTFSDINEDELTSSTLSPVSETDESLDLSVDTVQGLCTEIRAMLGQLSLQLHVEHKKDDSKVSSDVKSCEEILMLPKLLAEMGRDNDSPDKLQCSELKKIFNETEPRVEPSNLNSQDNCSQHSMKDFTLTFPSKFSTETDQHALPTVPDFFESQDEETNFIESKNAESGQECDIDLNAIYPPPTQFCSSRDSTSPEEHKSVTSTVVNELLIFIDLMQNVIGTMADS